METCNCLRQQSIPNYKPIERIVLNDAIELIKGHSEYDADKYTISIYEDINSHLQTITIAMESYKCNYSLQYYDTLFNSFTDWLNEAFNYFNKMEEDNDIF